jgi:DNA-directed RNA polymerase subunit RPC12/RpoP
MQTYDWGTLEIKYGREERLQRVCITCYEALINDEMLAKISCDSCDSKALTILREYYHVVAKKQKIRTFREMLRCDDCDKVFICEDQKKANEYRKVVISRYSLPEKLML